MGSALLRRVVGKGILRFGSRIGWWSSGARRNISIDFHDPDPEPEPMLMAPPFFDEEGRMENKFHNLMRPSLDTRRVPGSFKTYEKQSSGVAGDEIKNVEVVGMSFGWLTLYNRMSQAMHILDPITGRRMDLPSLPDAQLGPVSRAIISNPPDQVEWWGPLVAIVFGGGRRLALCQAGVSREWTVMADDNDNDNDTDEREYEDIIFDEEPCLYCLTRNPTHLEVWKFYAPTPTDPTLCWVYKWPEFDGQSFCWPSRSREDLELKRRCWRTKYIMLDPYAPACDGNKFYMVVRHILPPTLGRPYKTIDFDVYTFGQREALRYMKCSLNEQVVFIGTNQSCSVGYTLGFNSNSIYFTDHWHNMPFGGGGHDNGIFDYKNYSFTGCCGGSCPLDEKKILHPAPLWFMYYTTTTT